MSDGVNLHGNRPGAIPGADRQETDTVTTAGGPADAGAATVTSPADGDSFASSSSTPGLRGDAIRPSGGPAGRSVGTFDPVGIRSVDAIAAGHLPPLPARLPLGVCINHRFDDPRVTPSHVAQTSWVPLPSADLPGELRDMNAKPFDERYPDRFVVGDAGITRAFIGVDKRPGTPLAKKLDEIVAQIPVGPSGERDPAQVIEWLRSNVNRIIDWAPGSSANDGRPYFSWDKAISVAPDFYSQHFGSVAFRQVGEAPLDTGGTHPVAPFERYLDEGLGYCIQKALLAALVLDRLGIPSKLEHGSVALGPGSSNVGHSWVRLADGRILDAAWSQLKRPGEQNPQVPEQFKFGWSYRFVSKSYPYLAGAD